MTRRQHTYLDVIGQILIFILCTYFLIRGYEPSRYRYMYRTPTTLEYSGMILRLITYVLIIWQIINGLVNMYMYQRKERKRWLKILGIYILSFVALYVIFWVLFVSLIGASFSMAVSGSDLSPFLWLLGTIFEFLSPFSGHFTTVVFTLMGGWYFGMTLRDISIMRNKTI